MKKALNFMSTYLCLCYNVATHDIRRCVSMNANKLSSAKPIWTAVFGGFVHKCGCVGG